MKNEFKFSIKLIYDLDMKIIKMATHPLIMHGYLPDLYTKIYVPFERAIRSIMIQFKVANEGELYGTDLKFKLCDNSNSKNYYKCDPGLKHESAIMALNQRMGKLISLYEGIFQQYIQVIINLSH